MTDQPINARARLAAALRDRIAIIGDEASRKNPDAHMERLREISERIDQLQVELPKPVPPQLVHYLQRASYSKALEFLEAEGA